MKTLGVKNICFFFFFFLISYIYLLLVLFSSATWEKQLQHLILPGSGPARKMTYFFSQLSQNWLWLSHLPIPEWVRSEELISLGLVTWGSTQTIYMDWEQGKDTFQKKSSSYQKKWGTLMSGKGDINSTLLSPTASYPIHYQTCLSWKYLTRSYLHSTLHQKLLGCLLKCRL